jgi:hypothetical protein
MKRTKQTDSEDDQLMAAFQFHRIGRQTYTPKRPGNRSPKRRTIDKSHNSSTPDSTILKDSILLFT